MRGHLSSLGAVLFVVGLGALIWQALVQPAPERLGRNTAAAEASPGLEVRDTTLVGWGRGAEHGKKLWKLTARRITLSPDQRHTSFDGVSEAFLFRDGQPYARVNAGSARYDRYANTLQVRGNVELRLVGEDARLTTDGLLWQGHPRVVEVPHPVTLWTGGSRLQASRARVDLKKEAIRVENVTGDVRGVALASATCDYDVKSQMLTVTPLRLAAGEWTLSAARARIDPRTGDYQAEKVHMATAGSILTLAQRGARPGVRVASAGLLAGLLSTGAAAAPGEAAKKAEEPKQRTLIFDAERMEKYSRPDGSDVLILSGNAVVTHPDPKDPAKKMVLTAERIETTEYPDESVIAVASGKPKVKDERSEVVGEKITVHVRTRRAVVEGKVKIVTRPKKKVAPAAAEPAKATPADGSASSEPKRPRSIRDRIEGDVIITADRAEYNYRTKNALAEGEPVVVTNKGRRLTLPKVDYDDAKELLTLTGPIDYRDEKNQTVHHAGDAEYSLKEGAESFQTIGKSKVTGLIYIKDDEDEASKEEPKPPAPAPAAPAPDANKPAEPPAGNG